MNESDNDNDIAAVQALIDALLSQVLDNWYTWNWCPG
jgi:hypothetical protein